MSELQPNDGAAIVAALGILTRMSWHPNPEGSGVLVKGAGGELVLWVASSDEAMPSPLEPHVTEGTWRPLPHTETVQLTERVAKEMAVWVDCVLRLAGLPEHPELDVAEQVEAVPGVAGEGAEMALQMPTGDGWKTVAIFELSPEASGALSELPLLVRWLSENPLCPDAREELARLLRATYRDIVAACVAGRPAEVPPSLGTLRSQLEGRLEQSRGDAADTDRHLPDLVRELASTCLPRPASSAGTEVLWVVPGESAIEATIPELSRRDRARLRRKARADHDAVVIQLAPRDMRVVPPRHLWPRPSQLTPLPDLDWLTRLVR